MMPGLFKLRAGMLPALLAALLLVLPGLSMKARAAEKIDDHLGTPEFKELIDTLVTGYGFERSDVMGWFRKITLRERVAQKLANPAEAKPYYEYRDMFISPHVKELGLKYLAAHKDLLDEVERREGVSPTAVAAILGIETKFGSVKTSYHALDALGSAFALYPSRRAFFRKELIEYLLLCREEKVDPYGITSSYAGALGVPQFMPSSFRAYAVDFDGDGRRDIWNSDADIAGSIANYLKVHGWKTGEPLKAEITPTTAQAAELGGGPKQKFPLSRLIGMGLNAPEFARVPATEEVAVVSYEEADGHLRWFVIFDNFAAIMRYNISVNYAMVATELDDFFRTGA